MIALPRSLSDNAQAMVPSGIREISEHVFALEAQGKGPFISLTAGEPSFRAPDHVQAAAIQQIQKGHMGYIENAGMTALRLKLAEMLSRRHGVATIKDNVLVSIGAMGCLSSSALALFNAGDEVLVPDPGYPNYGMIFALIGAKLVPYACPSEKEFQPDMDDVAVKIGPKTAGILVCSPSNPTGAVMTEESLDRFVTLARMYNLWLLSDEIYEDLVYEEPFKSLVSRAPERTVYYSGFSKTYAMTGYRVGYMRAPAPLIDRIAHMHEALVSCGVPAAQAGALAALEGDQSIVADMRASYQARRDAVVALVQEAGLETYVPGGAFYLMLGLPALPMDSRAFCFRLLETEQVAVAPGRAFGMKGEGHVRISLATAQEKLLEGVSRLLKIYKTLC